MNLFPKSNSVIFRRRITSKLGESDMIETASPKLHFELWEKALRHGTVDNDAMFEKEMAETLEQINSFLYGLEVDSKVHDNRKFGKEHEWAKYKGFEQQYRNKIMLGHILKEKMKELLDLENSGIRLSRSFKSSSISSISSGMYNSQKGSEGNISNCSRYGSEIKDVLCKFNDVLVKNSPLAPKVLGLYVPDEQKHSGVETDALEFLTERLAIDNIQPIFTSHPLKSNESSHTISCRVFNINVQGKASEKSAAKKAAALNMLERLIEDNAQNQLPSQITPFTDLEVQEAMEVLCEQQRYDTKLADLCLEECKRLPQYTNDSSKHSLRTLCSALGLQGLGTRTNPVMARRLAAREVLLKLKQKSTY